MQEDAESLKAKILAKDPDLTVEKFDELIQIKDKFTVAELQDLYKTFIHSLHGGKFSGYAESIFKHHPAVDKSRSQMERANKASITNFFAKKEGAGDDTDKRPREPAKKADAKKSPKKKPTIDDYFQRNSNSSGP